MVVLRRNNYGGYNMTIKTRILVSWIGVKVFWL